MWRPVALRRHPLSLGPRAAPERTAQIVSTKEFAKNSTTMREANRSAYVQFAASGLPAEKVIEEQARTMASSDFIWGNPWLYRPAAGVQNLRIDAASTTSVV